MADVFAVTVLVVMVGVAWVVGGRLERRANNADSTTQVDQMNNIAEALTKGVGLLTALLGVLTARGGGIGRLLANARAYLYTAVLCILASILLAFTAWLTSAVAGHRGLRVWLATVAASIALFGVSITVVVRASEIADDKLERPTLAVEHSDNSITFTATINLLRATDLMRTTVHGYPTDGSDRELLFNSTTGPDAEGSARVTGATTSDLSEYGVVEVRAFRGPIDPGCERPLIIPEVQKAESGEAACASVWLKPLTEG